MKHHNHKRGFTLIESVLAIAVIGAGLVGVMYAFQGSVSSSLLADQSIIASNIAREALERIVAQRDNNADGNVGYTDTLAAIQGGTYTLNNAYGQAGFNLVSSAVEVNPNDNNATDDFLDAQPGSGYARVTVTVSWNSAANSIKLETLLAKYKKPF